MFKFEKVNKQFSDTYVLSDFSYEISEGDKISISGRSGIGKTTLFRLLLGFEKANSGFIYFNGKLLNDEMAWEIRKQVAYVSQDLNIGRGEVRSLFTETMSYKANLQHKEAMERELSSHLAYFELPLSILDKKLEELSGGEKQRIAIINALILKRTIFFLDEVSSALDSSLKAKVIDYFLTNAAFTVLYISHDKYLPEHVDIKTLKLK